MKKTISLFLSLLILLSSFSLTVFAEASDIPHGTSISSLNAVVKGFRVTWHDANFYEEDGITYPNNISGYQIQYSNNSYFSSGDYIEEGENAECLTKTQNITDPSITSATISHLKGKTKYYVRIRAYKDVDKDEGGAYRYYSSWSGAKSVTTRMNRNTPVCACVNDELDSPDVIWESHTDSVVGGEDSDDDRINYLFRYIGKSGIFESWSFYDRDKRLLVEDVDYTVSDEDDCSIGVYFSDSFYDNLLDENPYDTPELYAVANVSSNIYVPRGTSILSLNSYSGGFVLSWSDARYYTDELGNAVENNITGYQVQYSTRPDFMTDVDHPDMYSTRTKTVSNSATTQKSFSTEYSDKYFVRIRTYGYYNEKRCYSDWSAVRTVDTNKVAIEIKSNVDNVVAYTIKDNIYADSQSCYGLMYEFRYAGDENLKGWKFYNANNTVLVENLDYYAVYNDYDVSIRITDWGYNVLQQAIQNGVCTLYVDPVIEKADNTIVNPPHTHTYTSYISKSPTCETDGVMTFVCIGGDYGYNEPIAATGHSYSADAMYCKNGCGTLNPSFVQPQVSKPKALKAPSSVKAIAGKKQIKLAWKQVSGAAGYKIQYSTDKSFKKNTKTITVGKNAKSKTIKGLKSKKKYYIRIRSYNKTTSSSWSSTKSIKIK